MSVYYIRGPIRPIRPIRPIDMSDSSPFPASFSKYFLQRLEKPFFAVLYMNVVIDLH